MKNQNFINREYHHTINERLLIQKIIGHRGSRIISWRICFAFALSMFACLGFSDDSSNQAVSEGGPVYWTIPSAGASISALGFAEIYSNPPSPLWGNILNKKISEAEIGQAFRVISKKKYPSFLGGNEIWLQVEQVESPVKDDKFNCKTSNVACWTFLGIQPDDGEEAVTWNFSVEQ